MGKPNGGRLVWHFMFIVYCFFSSVSICGFCKWANCYLWVVCGRQCVPQRKRIIVPQTLEVHVTTVVLFYFPSVRVILLVVSYCRYVHKPFRVLLLLLLLPFVKLVQKKMQNLHFFLCAETKHCFY